MEHIPVLVSQVLENLITDRGGVYLDGTVGCGGHAFEIMSHLNSDGRLVASDWDSEALKIATERLVPFGGRVSFFNQPFSRAPSLLSHSGGGGFDGLLLDLGVSSFQLDSERGFSYRYAHPLDMRMDSRKRLTAGEIVNTWDEKELSRIIKDFGEERHARRVTKAIIRSRPHNDSRGLGEVIARSLGRGGRRIHPATRTFQALRLAVNGELDELNEFLGSAHRLLKTGGRLVIIAFHSLEDRLVKNYFRGAGKDCFKTITKKPIRPEADEVAGNSRSRSARLRVGERNEREGPCQSS